MSELFKILKSIFKFLSSLKLAVVVILSLAYVLAMGTIYESLYGTPVAKEKVYGTWWFTLVLFFLGLNVLCAALSRLPWKRHHIGFVVTHAGIITILIGSVITQRIGVDGSLPLAEGEESDRLSLDDPLLQVAQPDAQTTLTWQARFDRSPPSEEKSWSKDLKDGFRFVVDRFFLHSQINLDVNNDNLDDNPAIQVVLSGLPMGGGQEVSQWLFSKETDFTTGTVQLGPAKISLLDHGKLKGMVDEASKSESQKIGSLKFSSQDGKSTEVDVEKAMKEEVALPGSDLRIKVTRYYPDARVVNNHLESISDQPNNPALEFKIFGRQLEESHVVFARYPDLEGIHGQKDSKFGLKSIFISNAPPPSSTKAELYLALNPEGGFFYRIRSHGSLGPLKTAKVGEEVATGWMTIRFKVAQYFPKAQVKTAYRKVVLPQGKSGPPPAVHFKIEKDGKSIDDWMQQGDTKEVALGGVPFTVRYGLRAHPLGFSIKLKKFDLGHYAGTNNPSSFASEVEVKNAKSGESFDALISMNHPLDYEGFKFYQASYQEGQDGAPNVSILSVGKDPGTPIKYTGSILLVGGISLMFWFKPLFIQKKIAAKKNAEGVGVISSFEGSKINPVL
jgi:hypothetical protein